jgi:primosomal protein N'
VVVGGPEAVGDVANPALDLVGILDADRAGRRPGLAAAERALATWMEVASWARPAGRVIVQASAANDPAIQALVAGSPARFHRAEAERRARAGFPPGAPVFRVAGSADLPARLEALQPLALLATASAERRRGGRGPSRGDRGGTVCLVTLEPGAVAAFGRLMRELAAGDVVDRVEAEPHL